MDYHNACGYQTWQGEYIHWASIHKLTQPFDPVILKGHIKYWVCCLYNNKFYGHQT